jgi:arsenite/tail-anchored protein-transporting ATPase
MRVLLFTGKGGVGKTSIAAATALRAAAGGTRTLVMSTDPAHSLGDAFDTALGAEPTLIAPNLHAEQIDARRRLEENWREIQEYLIALLNWGGVEEVAAEELSILPGLEEIFSLIDVRRHVEAAEHDLLVVDCAPTAETLRLLSLPDALGWYLERIFPFQRKIANVVRPVLGRVTTMPLPQERMMAAVDDLHRNLQRVREILLDADRTSVRLVVNAEKLVIAEARRTFTYLSLFGYNVDAVMVNRLLPDSVQDPYFDQWKALQAEHLGTIRASFGATPVLTAPLFEHEPVGATALGRLAAEVYAAHDPTAVLHRAEPLHVERRDGAQILCLPLPLVDKTELDVLRRDDELYVRVGSYQRSLLLPAALQRGDVAGARLVDGRLEVSFTDPPIVETA